MRKDDIIGPMIRDLGASLRHGMPMTYVFANYFGLVARNQVLSQGDHQLQEALTLFDRAKELAERRAAADPVAQTSAPN